LPIGKSIATEPLNLQADILKHEEICAVPR
jgi:hypothetical protein